MSPFRRSLTQVPLQPKLAHNVKPEKGVATTSHQFRKSESGQDPPQITGDEIADVVARMTSTGKAKAAIAATEAQQKRREVNAKARQEAADRLVELPGDRARLDAEGRRVAAQTDPARFLAVQLGTDAESVIRWLVALPVMLIDPSVVVLTIAAARRRRGG
jgi:hypothetical protein